ncbi:Bax inhibitor-1 family protein [Solirubrobacter phytolaccae]|uniref:Bax inhibitor-1 family protein n=1 Tax=Solirubrobacter phytolaccae TaxID=1404360 RepID=A0A9X3NA82_9ACTN|nr:Bax inhibitor-1 family protein [Solirubrobacter phytolaccae]MDA0178947.1 Bax inhibitor-1 family protein [Solirubrobacter phytolaccae]
MSTYAPSAPLARTSSSVFGRVMSLVGVAIAFTVAGAYFGRDLALGTAQVLGFVAIGMLFAQSFSASLRRGSTGLTWLFALALILGLSLGPVLQVYANAEPDVVIQAAGATALTTLAMGAWGMATSADLSRWMRPLSYAMLGLFVIGLLLLLFGGAGNPLFSLAVIAVSAALLVIDFNFVRNRANDDDVIWLATGIFVSILNLFISFLNLFGRR